MLQTLEASSPPAQAWSLDGAQVGQALHLQADVVVVGSGPAGAVVARDLAAAGAQVCVLEEGPPVTQSRLGQDSLGAMADLYRALGATVALGRAPIPLVQGRAVGGTSVVNGAICWRLPQDVYQGWVVDDPALADAVAWEELEALTTRVEQDLHVAPTGESISGAHNLLLAQGAAALGLEHRAIRRNVVACQGLGACLQGCPQGNKLSMDKTYLPAAVGLGATVVAHARVDRICVERGRAVGVRGRTAAGARVEVRAPRVVVAAGAVHSPMLLMRSGLGGGMVGRNLMCHPGVSVCGWFKQDVRIWTGATQGHEVTGLRSQGLKFEALGYDLALVASRLKGAGAALAGQVAQMEHAAQWGCAVRAGARGRVRAMPWGPHATYALLPADMAKVRAGVAWLCRLMLAAGATGVQTGVHGAAPQVHTPAQCDELEEHGPLDARAYTLAATHLFGTCRMGSNPDASVVNLAFEHHRVPGLTVCCASVFPSNTGVNPQISIMALAAAAARRILAA